MNNIKANFKLKEPESLEPTLIYLKSYLKRKRLVYSTGIKIRPKHWDDRVQRPVTYRLGKIKDELKYSSSEILKLEKREIDTLIREETRLNPSFETQMKYIINSLKKIEDEFEKAIQHLINHNLPINNRTVKAQLIRNINPDQPDSSEEKDFWQRLDEFIEIKGPVFSPLTIKKYNTLKKRLIEFEKSTKYKITFESIDLVFYANYKAYLLDLKNPKRESKRGLLNDTISKEFSAIKSFMQWSLEREYHSNTTFQSKQFSAKRKGKQDQVSLTRTEFESVYELDLSPNLTLEKVRDLFCFAVFTGQRWSDMIQFDKKQLQGNIWVFYSQKTKDYMKIPLMGYSSRALTILEKYNYILPKISQQRFNDYIKEVGDKAGINTKISIKRESGSRTITKSGPKYTFITSHVARRTCVTLMLELDYPIAIIRKITGHKDIETLMRYENVSDKAVLEAFQNLS